VGPLVTTPRPARELYDLTADPTESRNLLTQSGTGDDLLEAEAIAGELALKLDDWRHKTNDVIPSDFAGTRISERYTQTYLSIHGRPATSRSGIAADRGVDRERSGQD
jgi:hypothetical protein